MNEVNGLYSGMSDKNGNKIYYCTSILRLPDGSLAKLMFDYGQLSAYLAREDGSYITEYDGVNNANSIYLRDCEVNN